MNNNSNGCYICGESNPEVIQEHHIVPKRHNGSDKKENLVNLCANCHQAVEKIYDKKFYDKIGMNKKENGYEKFQFEKVPSIYLAGKMDWEYGRGEGITSEDSHWRASVQNSQLSGKYDLISPYDTYFDHGGHRVIGTVTKDLELIDKSDAVLAFISREDQIGTVTEIFEAINQNKPVLVLFEIKKVKRANDESYLIHEGVAPDSTDSSGKVAIRSQAPHYWFLWNYLKEKSDKTDLIQVKSAQKAGIKKHAEEWLDDLGAHHQIVQGGVTSDE